MRRGIWRSATAAAALVGLVVVAPPAAAGPPYEEVYQGTDVFCYGSVDDRNIEIGAFYLPSGEIEYGYGSVYTEESGIWASSAEGQLAGGAFGLDLQFVNDAGEPAGSMSLAGTVAPMGDPESIDDSGRDGNSQYRISGTVQYLVVDGEITGATGELADLAAAELTCGGAEVDITQWSTNPATRIYRGSGSGGYCALGEDGMLSVDVWGEEAYGLVALGIDWAQDEPTPELIAEGPLAYDGSTITGLLEVYEPPPANEPQYVGVDLQVGSTVIDRGMNRGKSRNGAFMERYVRYELTGTVTPPDGPPIAIEDCTFSTYAYMERYSSRAGQKPGGQPPVNDLPEDAAMLGTGTTDRTSTRGAALLPEVPILVTDAEGTWEFPFGRTVWYSIEGTGGEVTVSTVGSGFDTVLAVYDEQMGELAWVDDTEETGLAASVSLTTVEGANYLVQVGGFDADWGNLLVSLS